MIMTVDQTVVNTIGATILIIILGLAYLAYHTLRDRWTRLRDRIRRSRYSLR